MSQGNSPEPQANQPEPTNDSRNQRPQRRVQPVWKGTIIQLLRGTIGILEATVEKLETAPPSGTEAAPGFWRSLASKWSRFLLKQVRPFLPSNLSTKVSDAALTGIIASITVILVWTTATLFTNKPTEIATVPPVEEVPTPTPTPTPAITTPPVSTTPEPQPAEEVTPSPEAQLLPPSPEPEATPEPETTPEPEATPEPETTPTPKLELTPEETLIAAIENQVAEISNGIASGIIKSIQANFRTSSLTVKINDDWYNLKASEQNQLVAEILQRSQELDFAHLEIIDSQDRLVARNPVVGTEMIIFQRTI